MPRYSPVGSSTFTPAQLARVKTIDHFISKWITKVTPEDIERAITSNQDPRIVWKASEIKKEAANLLSAVKIGGALMDFLNNNRSSTTSAMVQRYITRDNLMLYLTYIEPKHPNHVAVIRRLAPASYVYLENGIRALLSDIL